jgi:hypothetical protein
MMRVQVVSVEGSPEELRAMPEVLDVLRGLAGTAPDDDEPAHDDEELPGVSIDGGPGRLPKELSDFIAIRAGGRARQEAATAFVQEVLGWGTTEAELGRSRTSTDGLGNYVLLYSKGPRRYGAFAYVIPGRAKVIFRLLGKDVTDFKHVELRNVKEGTGYEVTVLLTSDEAIQEALKLAELALEHVRR